MITAMVVLAIIVALIIGILKIPHWLAPLLTSEELERAGVDKPRDQLELQDARRKLQNDVRTTLGHLIVGAAVVAGLFFSWQTLRGDQRQAEDDRQQFRDQLEVSRQGQMAERFSRAVEQLASTKLEVRLGGIYALERLATSTSKDDRNENDQRLTIYEVLTAYVRQHAPNNSSTPNNYNRARPPWSNEPAPEIQAILTVLGRRIIGDNDPSLNLSYVYLRGVNLAEAGLRRVDFRESNLGRADLREANLEKSQLNGADLEKADLNLSNLEGADLSGANLYGTNLEGAKLQGAYIDSISLNGVSP